MGAKLLGVLVALAAGLVLVSALAWAFQRRLIYFPSPGQVPPVAGVLPGGEESAFTTADGLELRAWFLPAAGAGPAQAVLVLPGNAGNRADRAPLAAALHRAGLGVLLVDYRGYGGNPGRPSEEGLASDARAARAWLAARPDVAGVAYFGESLGAAVALRLAVEQPPTALVLRSPFTSLADVGRRHYPYLPVGLLLADRYPSVDIVGRLRAPLLVVAGERDRVVPAAHSRRLYEAAPEPKRLLVVAGADHNDAALLDGEQLSDELARFLTEATGA